VEEENDRTIKILIEKFDAYCNPLKNESVERYKFYSRSQQSGETIYNYVTEFKLLAAHCGYGELKESLIRHCIVCGIRDVNLRERLLRETKLTLQNCLEICCASELSKERIKEIDNAPAAEVHAVRNPRNVKFKIGNQSDSRTQAKPKVMSHNCHYCGCKHEYNKRSIIQKGPLKVGNPGKLAIQGTQDEGKQTKTQQNMCWTPRYASKHK